MPTVDRTARELVDELLALPSPEQQERLLGARGLLNAAGLDALLDIADRLARDDPGKAQQLVQVCVAAAGAAGAPAVGPRADYLRAQTASANGEFAAALRLVESAHRGYVGLGMQLEALRTNVGRMAVLIELGRYEETLDAGRAVLEALTETGQTDAAPSREEADLLTAFVYNNLGGCYEYMGLYDDALEAYALAEAKFESLDMTERLGEVTMNRGAVLLYVGRGEEALAAQETAAAIFEGAGLGLLHTKALINIGVTRLQLGDYARGLDALQRARRLLGPLEALADDYYVLRDTADAYLALNLYSEALAAYREVDGLLRRAGMTHERAQVLWGMGSVLVAQSDFERARRVLEESARLFDAANNVPLLSSVMLEQSSVLWAQGETDGALVTAARALIPVSGDGWPVQRVYAHLRLADLLLPDVAEAEPHLLEAQRLSATLTLPHLRYRLNERLGRLRLLQGRAEEARSLLERAIEDIERFRGSLTQESMRASFLRDKTAAYEDLLRLHLSEGRGRLDQAFAVAERAKSRALVDLLTGVLGARPAAGPEEEQARLGGLQADLERTYGRLLLGDAGEDGGRRVSPEALNRRAVELEERISRLRLTGGGDGTAGSFARPLSAAQVREGLPPDVVLLTYHLVGDEVMAFVQARGRIRVERHLGSVGEVERLARRLAVQWDRFRIGREFAGRNRDLLERSTRGLLAQLYGVLVEPLEPLLAELGAGHRPAPGVQKLAVVPHGLLHHVPFHALFDGERYLIERFEISYAPSATVYALCQAQDARGSGRALIMGVEDPSIPAATVEARAVAGRVPGAELRVGDGATVAALLGTAGGCDIVHLACHGLFRSDNPMFSSLRLQDGWLSAADAMGLDLAGALVVLSACESGRNEVFGGDEVIGLTRAFLGAGAATLVVSLWLVQDETTTEMMGNWYERLRRGEGRAAALRAAQLELKDRHPHPYYWAPFVAIGQR